jgi:hypothetical protein
MRSRHLLAAFLLVPFFTGCVRTFQPILKDEQVAAVDKAMLGRWVSKDGNESAVVTPAEKENTYRLVYTEKEGKKGTLLVRIGKVGDLTLAELRADDPAPEANDIYKYHLMPVYSFLIVHKTDPQLVISMMPQDWLKKYLDGHPNELQTVQRDDNLIVTSSTADFQAFLLRHYKDEGAIGEPEVFVRPGDATTQPAAPAK